MSSQSIQVCPNCQVRITGNDTVLFSAGAPGSRARLWARVCQYVQKSGCINQNQELIGQVTQNDHYN